MNPLTIREEAELEGYIYFDKHIRLLPRKSDGSINTMQPGFQHNDVDAFRHAYVSGIFMHKYGEKVASLLGWINEYWSDSVYDRNMDLWNNKVGRELACNHKTKEALADAIKDALQDGKLIIRLSDERVYKGAAIPKPEGDRSIIVLKESPTGVNELFFDFNNSATMTRNEFVSAIVGDKYPGYTIRRINGVDYPVSKRDGKDTNNLG